MHTALPVAREEASETAATFCREILKIAPVQNVGKKLPGYSFGRLCRALWPKKTPASLEYYTGMAERTARHAISSTTSDPGSIHLVSIIDSDQGWRALLWIMRDSKQPWWRELLRAQRCARAFDGESQQFELEFQ